MSRRSQSKLIPCDAHLWPFTVLARYSEVFDPLGTSFGSNPGVDRSQDEILVRLPRARITAICKKPRWNKANLQVLSPAGAINSKVWPGVEQATGLSAP